jgi:DNA helicase-2/ATP-dependent DNA helicase PcrA
MDLLADLTPPQQEAVTHVDGPLLVLAGAGSGKTRVITRRVAYLLAQGVPAHQILAITFTNKASDEMRSRIAALTAVRGLTVATFHSFCARVLRTHAELVGVDPNFVIYTQADSRRMVKQAVEKLDLDATHWSPDKIQGRISYLKNHLKTAAVYANEAVDYAAKNVARIYTAYEEAMAASNALDFDDLMVRVAKALADNEEFRESLQERYRYILIDEYQDTNEAQYTISKTIAARYRNVCATGDPDQSIYGWRGANLNNILDFEKDFVGCRVIRLERNYRSTPQILAAAGNLIRHNRKRKPKELLPVKPDGPQVRVIETESAEDEARRVAELIHQAHPEGQGLGGIAVFYRVNSLSRAIEDSLRVAGVPYEIVRGTSFYERHEIRTLVAYLRAMVNPADDVALHHIINVPPRAIGDTTVEKLDDFAAGRRITLLESCRLAGEVPGLAARAQMAVSGFVKLMEELAALDRTEIRPLVESILARTGYVDYCRKLSDGEEERIANVDEFVTVAEKFDEAEQLEGPSEEAEVLPSIMRFLERVSLTSDQDDVHETAERVHLMTLHAAKGLEFPKVFIIGLEDGLMPHVMAEEDGRDIEEERRLCFVGITRAQQELTLTYARYRMLRGVTMRQGPSVFLQELGEQGVQRQMLSHDEVSQSLDEERRFRSFGGGQGFSPRRTAVPRPAAARGERQYEPTDEEQAQMRAALPRRHARAARDVRRRRHRRGLRRRRVHPRPRQVSDHRGEGLRPAPGQTQDRRPQMIGLRGPGKGLS